LSAKGGYCGDDDSLVSWLNEPGT
jgi:DNA-binding transcriptional ArsR family regulator